MVSLSFSNSNMANSIDMEGRRCFINDRKFILTDIYNNIYVRACILILALLLKTHLSWF